MKKRIGILIVILIGLGLYYGLNQWSPSTESNLYYGEVLGQTYTISSQVSGIITSISVDEGMTIDEGSLLATIDHELLDLQIASADMAINAASLQLEQVLNPTREEDLSILNDNVALSETQQTTLIQSIEQAKISLNQANNTLSQAQEIQVQKETDYNRTQALYDEGIVSQQSLESTKLSLDDANNVVAQSQLNIETIESQIKSLQSQLSQLKINEDIANEQLTKAENGSDTYSIQLAEINLSQAELTKELLNLQLEDYTIYSDKSYYIETINYKTGELVSIGAPIITVYNPTDLHLNIYINESDLVNIQENQSISLRSPGTGDSVTGIIASISNEAMYTPLNVVTVQDYERLVFKVDITFTAKDSIKPGMLLEVDLSTLKAGDSIEP